MNIKLLCLATFAGFSPAFAQNDSLPSAWTLENCIQYAQEHNITLKQKQQEEKQREVELHTSRFSWLPDLNAGLNQNFDFGRSPSRTGVIADQNSANTSVSISLSMPIFDGLRTPNDIKAKKLNLQAATESLNKAREDLAVNIASYFLQVLYNRELEQVARLQVDFSAKQVEQTKALVDAGRQPLSELYNIKAQLAQDEVSLTEASNNVRLALLDLAQADSRRSSTLTLQRLTTRSSDICPASYHRMIFTTGHLPSSHKSVSRNSCCRVSRSNSASRRLLIIRNFRLVQAIVTAITTTIRAMSSRYRLATS